MDGYLPLQWNVTMRSSTRRSNSPVKMSPKITNIIITKHREQNYTDVNYADASFRVDSDLVFSPPCDTQCAMEKQAPDPPKNSSKKNNWSQWKISQSGVSELPPLFATKVMLKIVKWDWITQFALCRGYTLAHLQVCSFKMTLYFTSFTWLCTVSVPVQHLFIRYKHIYVLFCDRLQIGVLHFI